MQLTCKEVRGHDFTAKEKDASKPSISTYFTHAYLLLTLFYGISFTYVTNIDIQSTIQSTTKHHSPEQQKNKMKKDVRNSEEQNSHLLFLDFYVKPL